jgi:hypothetical protein
MRKKPREARNGGSTHQGQHNQGQHILTDGHFAPTLARVEHSLVINRARRALT